MATTATKKSRAKKPVAKKRSAAKASSKKTISKKAVAAKAPAKKDNGSVTLEKLYKFNIFTAASNLVFAVLSVVFLSRQTVDVVLSHLTKDELASTTNTVLGPAYKTLASVEVRYLLAAIFVISAVFSLLLATKLRARYETGVKNSTSFIRWIFMGVTLGLILELASLLAGVQDKATLKLVAGLILTTSLLGYIAERENKGSSKHYAAFGLSVFTGILAWLPLVMSLVGTAVYGSQRFSWYVYALSAYVLFGFCSIALTQYRHVKNGASSALYLQLEGKYVSTDFLLKLGTFVILVIALYK